MILRSRFAPSPTGLLHIGNARSAVLNWAYILNKGGEFILRIDDTDKERSNKVYEKSIKEDLKWLGISWIKTFNQSDRYELYNKNINELIKLKRIYPCFESLEELSLKKKSQLTSGKPPIYDRSSLNLSEDQINELIKSGKKPHWRFKLEDKKIEWNDLIKGRVSFDSKKLSDPIVIREDGSLLYHLPSVIDDIEENIYESNTLSQTITFSLNVESINDPPTLINTIEDFVFEEELYFNQEYEIFDLDNYFVDVDEIVMSQDDITYTVAADNTQYTVTIIDGSILSVKIDQLIGIVPSESFVTVAAIDNFLEE